jgi:hypothetical protein
MITAHASRPQTLSFPLPISLFRTAPAREISSALYYVFVTLGVNGCSGETAQVCEPIRLKAHPIVKGLQQPRGRGPFQGAEERKRLGKTSASTAVMIAFNIPVWRFLMSLPD